MAGEAIVIGPFVGGLNTYSDPTAVGDNQLVKCENFELDFDGSLKSRPPIVDRNVSMPLGATGNMTLLGYYYAPGGIAYLIASNGLTSTYYYTGTSWTILTNTIAASAMSQFGGKAWLMAPVGSANPGGNWDPSAGFVADANMPKGEVLVAHKSRLWAAVGKGAVANGTTVYFSKVLGTVPLWPAVPDFVDIGSGDGQNIVQIVVYYQQILIFRTNSIYNFLYSTDPASGSVNLIAPGIGLSDKDALVPYEGFLYFMDGERGYEFYNNRATQINQQVPFMAIDRTGLYKPFAASTFGNRIIFSYYDTMFVFSLNTRTWTTWVSTTHGPIGKIITLEQTSQFISGVVHSSRTVAAAGSVVRTNRVINPTFNAASTGAGMWAGSAPGAGSMAWSAGAGFESNGFVRSTWTVATNTKTGGCFVGGIAISANTQYTLSMYVRPSINQVIVPQLQFFATATPTVYATGPAFYCPAGVWTRIWMTATSGASDTTVDWKAYSTDANSSFWSIGSYLDMDAVQVETGPVATEFMAGSLTDTIYWDYAWTGTVNASTSTATSLRTAKTLFITDGITTEAEAFHCTAQTKNYNYEASSTKKRLFWWGADANFRTTVTALATPITFNQQVTWGTVRGTTWGMVKQFTWSQPFSGTLAIQTVRSTAGTGAMRKFVKFAKSLYFRQINFKVDFDTDGSSSTAPVRLFTLVTYVSSKATVSKTVS
jgi:hypothetical protein